MIKMYKMENDEKLDRIENVIYSIREAMSEFEGIKEFKDYYMELDVMRCDLQDLQIKLEKIVNKEQEEE